MAGGVVLEGLAGIDFTKCLSILIFARGVLSRKTLGPFCSKLSVTLYQRDAEDLARSTEVFRLSSLAKRSDGDAKETQTGDVNLQRDSKFIMDSEEDDCDGEDISFCDFSDILDKMASINMDDGQNIESRIAGELKPEERAALILTAEDESKIIAALGASLNEGKLRKSSL